MTTAEGVMGFQGIAINVWLIWMLPFIGAALISSIAQKQTKSFKLYCCSILSGKC